MVAYERDIDSFLSKSTLLLEVFPQARLTTKYRKLNKDRAFITAKLYDAPSGALVKFKTDKSIDLGRLMVGTTKLSSSFAGQDLTEMAKVSPGVNMTEASEDVTTSDAVKTEAVESTPSATEGTNLQKKKKKKGKK